MFNVIGCIAFLIALLAIAETLGRLKLASPENKRKFFHMSAGSFIAFWPWLISWRTIEVLGVLMLLAVLANTYLNLFNFTAGIERRTFGDSFLAISISLCAYLAHSKVVFALAILIVALADGLAAVMGKKFGLKNWRYKVFGQTKTILGSMTFWLVTLAILGPGLLFINIAYAHYLLLIIFLPPALTILENISALGLDNIVIPLVAVAAIHLLVN